MLTALTLIRMIWQSHLTCLICSRAQRQNSEQMMCGAKSLALMTFMMEAIGVLNAGGATKRKGNLALRKAQVQLALMILGLFSTIL